MGLIATDTSQTVEFSLAADQGPDRTVFFLRSLDMRERAFITGRFSPGMRIRQKSENEEDVSSDLGTITPQSVVDSAIWAVRLGLRGWSNFLSSSGGSLPVAMEQETIPGVGTREVLTEECVLRNFRKEWVNELSAEILRLSQLTGEQRKN